MAEVFARSVANGGLANSSSQMPPTSDEERIDEDEFLHCVMPSSTATKGGTSSKGKRSLNDLMDIVGSTRKSTTKRLKEKMYNALDTVSMSISSKETCRKAREEETTMSMPTANPYSMKVCIEVLKNMSAIPHEAINAAIHKLANPDLREALIEMPPK